MGAAFDALTPGRQRAYLLYFSGAKQSKTRESGLKIICSKSSKERDLMIRNTASGPAMVQPSKVLDKNSRLHYGCPYEETLSYGWVADNWHPHGNPGHIACGRARIRT